MSQNYRFFLLTQAETTAFSQLKVFISVYVSKKKRTARKELVKRSDILGHVKRLNEN